MIKRLICLIFTAGVANAMVFDNRYLPLYLKPFTRRLDTSSYFRIQPFFMQASRALYPTSNLTIPDIDGPYDSVALANALVAMSHENPLRSDFLTATTIPWHRKGRLNAQGVAFLYEQKLISGIFGCDPCGLYVSFGLNALFGHVNSRHAFTLRDATFATLPEGDKEYLLSIKETMNRELNVTPAFYRHTGLGDLDFYLRFGGCWEYCYKMRRFDLALKCGVLAPTAARTPLNNPAAIPLGGEKHWGAYVELDHEVELKEDLIVGYMFRASKRFSKTVPSRMSVAGEPSRYGAVCGPLCVNPGWTFVFNPYASLEGLREGFGLKAQYTLVAHLKDSLSDARSAEARAAVPSLLDPVCSRSSWGMEHVTIGAFYDFGNIRECGKLYPRLSLYWDIPVDWLVAKRVSKTNSVSLMFELDF